LDLKENHIPNSLIQMLQRLKNAGFLILVMVFLAPSIIKLGHTHKAFFCNAKNEKHFHTHHENCEICQFDFSFFSAEEILVVSKKKLPSKNDDNHYLSSFSSCNQKYSFQLRAPPIYTI
jgi:hypothetical protein